MSDVISFTINEEQFNVNADSLPLDTTLNTFIRNHAHLSGTKFMCLEGGCGACIVNIRGIHPVTAAPKTWAANSCLMSIFSCHNLHITTIEGIGNRKDGYHAIQKRLADFNGSQCGYCSPGMIMNMYSLLAANDDKITMADVENSFGGNICRCTGYRPILDAFKSLATDVDVHTYKLIAKCKDIEDLDKVCLKTGSSCSKTCQLISNSMVDNNIRLKFSDGKSWHKVTTLQEIFSIFEQIKDEKYMLVAGNTAHGVYRRSDDIQTFIDITRVGDLHEHQLSKECLTIGASVSLTELMSILRETIKTVGFEYVAELVKHIDLIANVPVRNVLKLITSKQTNKSGTIAGNLSIKHAHNEFPSDMFLILDAIDAKLTIFESPTKSNIVSMADYLKLDMNHKVIVNVTLPLLMQDEFIFRSYKIMPRAQNAHAYVNAGFLIQQKSDTITSARICFGGIAPDFYHATQTEMFLLQNPKLYTNDTLKCALETIKNELHPDWNLPDASPDYRKQLALGLFYKFVISTCPAGIVAAEYLSGGDIFKRPLSSGSQKFDTYEDKWPLTQYVPKYEGLIQCSGEGKYTNDFPNLPKELWAAFVPATEVHVKVIEIDATKALKIPGVHNFFSAKDIPGENNFAVSLPSFPADVEEIFLATDSVVGFNGQPVGVILADSSALANYAVKFVSITYEKKKNIEVITTLQEAIKDEKRIKMIPFNNVSSQSADPSRTKNFFKKTFQKLCECDATNEQQNKATKNVLGKFQMGTQYHFTMEPQTTVCVPAEDGGIDVYCASQWNDSVQTSISKALKIPNNAINLHFKRLGGAYGSKISRPAQIACAAALACRQTNRPIRFVLSLESNMTVIGKRFSCFTSYNIDVDEQGKIEKLTNDYYEDSGLNYNDSPISLTNEFFFNCYVHDAWTVKSRLVLTDTASNTACRAPGTTEGIAMIEHMMEHIARETGNDPLNVRLANMSKDHVLRPIITKFLTDNDYYKRKSEIDQFNTKNRWTKRGIAIVPMQYKLFYDGVLPAYVAIYQGDGTVVVTHGGIEMGQGINTKVCQVAAHILGVPLSYIKIKECTNVIGANAGITGGSMTSEAVCFAVKKACEEILERMKPVRNELKNPEWIDIVNACYAKSIDLSGKYLFKVSDVKEYNIYGVTASEIEIDVLTGSIQILRVDILEDTGESLSPSVDIGQVEGAFIMGVGYWLTESLVYHNKTGELLTNRTWTYKPPGAKDIPIDFRITFLQKSCNNLGVLRSKATGEPPLCMSIVVLFALRNALESARKDTGITEPWFELDGPASPEVILLKCNHSVDNFKLN